jgi:hypothetical protein
MQETKPETDEQRRKRIVKEALDKIAAREAERKAKEEKHAADNS